jgi:hypothetical protein
VGGVLFALDVNSVQPASMGNFYELYAIAAAVLGGCSLRGGECSIIGIVLGTVAWHSGMYGSERGGGASWGPMRADRGRRRPHTAQDSTARAASAACATRGRH